MSSEWQLSGRKCHVDARGQRRIARLLWTYWMTALGKIITHYNQAMQEMCRYGKSQFLLWHLGQVGNLWWTARNCGATLPCISRLLVCWEFFKHTLGPYSNGIHSQQISIQQRLLCDVMEWRSSKWSEECFQHPVESAKKKCLMSVEWISVSKCQSFFPNPYFETLITPFSDDLSVLPRT